MGDRVAGGGEATVAGTVFAEGGATLVSLPAVELDDLTLTVESTDGRRVGKVLVVRKPRDCTGRFWLRLWERGWDTSRVANGWYRLRLTVEDTVGIVTTPFRMLDCDCAVRAGSHGSVRA